MNEIKKNIIFICIILGLVIIIFSLGFVLRGNQNRINESEDTIQILTGKLQFYITGLEFVSRESGRRIEIINNLSESNKQLEKDKQQFIIEIESIYTELRNANFELDRIGKGNAEGIKLIKKGLDGMGITLEEFRESIKKIETSLMD